MTKKTISKKTVEISVETAKKVEEMMSKFALDEKQLAAETIPNPILTGGLETIGLKRIQPILIPKYLLMHPAVPRAIEIKVNRMIKLIDEDLQNNIIVNKSGDKNANDARDYCLDILDNSDGPLYIKRTATDAYGFGTSFSILQKDKAHNKVLRFEQQHPAFFGPARYPNQIQGEGVNWDKIPRTLRESLLGKMKIDVKTKKISKFTQLTKKYPDQKATNYRVEAEKYMDT